MSTGVSEEHLAYIFKVKERAKARNRYGTSAIGAKILLFYTGL
jgi:hypothetical protein